ncbi:hypothetical protein [Pontibacter pamirensis]|uniref:hypothetical protein n=1 Tax=Pontibacter pamirensis TaxID=2562824 RepID=UPI00138A18DD|nr:hypothetical protein [Pontibacter pamirensis]
MIPIILNGAVVKLGSNRIRYQFLKNSIVWYSASYEMLWQALWFGFFLFRKNNFIIKKKPVTFYDIESKDIYQQLLTLCTYPNLERALLKVSTDHSALLLDNLRKFHECEEQKRVKIWVNKLKHNGNLKAKELYYKDSIELEEGKFNSNYTEPEVVAIDEMVNVLKGYHIKFCELVQYVYTFFDFASFIPEDRKVRRMDVREYKKIVIE